MRGDAVLRWMRALTLPSVLFTSALAGHAAGGGVIPRGPVLIPLFLLTVVAVIPFARTPARPAVVVALLVGGQGLLHTALQLLSGTAVPATVMCGADMGAAAVSSPSSCHLMTHSSTASHDFAMPLISGGHFVMVLGHMAAAVVAGVWLAAGERALATVLVLAALPLVNAWRTVTAVVSGGVGVMIGSYLRLLGWALPCAVRRLEWAAGAVSRRGPPGACTA